MAENIVAGMFGLSPYQIQQQRMAQGEQSAANFAQLDPFQRANYGIYKGGGMLAGAGAEAMGMVDPAVQEAQQRQASLQGLDVSNPEALTQRAMQIQDPYLKTQLLVLAQNRQSEIDESRLKQAQTIKALREQEGGSSPNVAKLLAERAKYPVGSEEYKTYTDAIKKETYLKPEGTGEMKPGDELRWMNQHSKDSQAAMSTIDTSTDAATKIVDIKNDPKFGYIFGGYTEKALSKFAPGEIAGLQSNVDSLKSTLMVAGLNTMRAGGGVGAITEREWPIFEKLVASLDQKMDEKTAAKRLDEIYSYFDRAKNRASETYQKKWAKKADYYDPEIVQRSKMPILGATKAKGESTDYKSAAQAELARRKKQ